MRTRLVPFALVLVGVVLSHGCAERQEDQVELRFRIATQREKAKGPGDCDEHFLLSIPLTVKRGARRVTAVHNGIWMDVAWDDLRRAKGRDAGDDLEFENFTYSLRNEVVAYGNSLPPERIGRKNCVVGYSMWMITDDKILTGDPYPKAAILYHQWRLYRQETKPLRVLPVE